MPGNYDGSKIPQRVWLRWESEVRERPPMPEAPPGPPEPVVEIEEPRGWFQRLIEKIFGRSK